MNDLKWALLKLLMLDAIWRKIISLPSRGFFAVSISEPVSVSGKEELARIVQFMQFFTKKRGRSRA